MVPRACLPPFSADADESRTDHICGDPGSLGCGGIDGRIGAFYLARPPRLLCCVRIAHGMNRVKCLFITDVMGTLIGMSVR